MNISCDVIKDLLADYVDDTLGEVTKRMVEEHLAQCEECKKYLEEIQDICDELESDNSVQENSVGALKRIKYGITRRNIIAIGISLIIVVVVLIISIVFANMHLSYIAYRDSGIVCRDNEIRTDENYSQLFGVDMEYNGENIEFVFLCSNMVSRNTRLKGTTTIMNMNQNGVVDDGHQSNQCIDKIYYLSEDAINKLPIIYTKNYKPIDLINMNQEEMIPQLIEKSTLIWTRE